MFNKPQKLLRIFSIFSRTNFTCQLTNQQLMTTYTKIKLNPQKTFAQKVGPFGWFLLLIPTSTFGLGTWQVYRKQWKEELLNRLDSLTNADPVDLPQDLSELKNMEYRPVRVRGHFLHDKELFLGPRTVIKKGETKSKLLSDGNTQGYLIVTPLKLADRNETILVNRGWVPAKMKKAVYRQEGQEKGEVNLIGIVRLTENRPTFVPKNQVENNQWFYKDLYEMARVTGSEPILVDATADFDTPQGPVGGQTMISLRNEHLSYILTWYGLSGSTLFLWYMHFVRGAKL